MSDYLTPDKRESYKWLSKIDKVDDLLASHVAADEMLREAREALRCTHDVDYYAPVDDEFSVCTCDGCTTARKIDAMLGGNDE